MMTAHPLGLGTCGFVAHSCMFTSFVELKLKLVHESQTTLKKLMHDSNICQPSTDFELCALAIVTLSSKQLFHYLLFYFLQSWEMCSVMMVQTIMTLANDVKLAERSPAEE
jgi:hypothetical protein